MNVEALTCVRDWHREEAAALREGEPNTHAADEHDAMADAIDAELQRQASAQGDRSDAMSDASYIAGANAGFRLGLENDNEGMRAIIDSRDGYIKTLRASAQGEAVACFRLWRMTPRGEWSLESRPWIDGAPAADLLQDIAGKSSSQWKIECAYTHPATQASVQGEAKPAYWTAVTDDSEIVVSYSADDGNGGEAARTECNQYINDVLLNDREVLRLVPLYAHPATVKENLTVPAERAGVPDGWQPIETAPKSVADGRKVTGIYLLGYTPDPEEDFDRQALIDVIWWEPLLSNTHGGRGKWCRNAGAETLEVQPTHWMPLPSAPSEGTQA